MMTPYLLEISWWGANKSLETFGRAPPSEVTQGNFEGVLLGYLPQYRPKPKLSLLCVAFWRGTRNAIHEYNAPLFDNRVRRHMTQWRPHPNAYATAMQYRCDNMRV